jgi:hypothetical protein
MTSDEAIHHLFPSHVVKRVKKEMEEPPKPLVKSPKKSTKGKSS